MRSQENGNAPREMSIGMPRGERIPQRPQCVRDTRAELFDIRRLLAEAGKDGPRNG